MQKCEVVVTKSKIEKSSWDGCLFDSVLAAIVSCIIIVFTCGIATPWAVCYFWRFIINHTIIDGKRLTFDGTGTQLFAHWILWVVLNAISCGIAGLWTIPKFCKWFASHTHIC